MHNKFIPSLFSIWWHFYSLLQIYLTFLWKRCWWQTRSSPFRAISDGTVSLVWHELLAWAIFTDYSSSLVRFFSLVCFSCSSGVTGVWWLSAPRLRCWALANSKTHLGVSSQLMNDPAAGGRINTKSVCLRVWDKQAHSAELEIPLNPSYDASARTLSCFNTLYPLLTHISKPTHKLSMSLLTHTIPHGADFKTV